ncbi:hypothetical protein [Pseudonocardia sp. GCM10023141]
MAFVIQIVAGKAPLRSGVRDVPGRGGNTEALLNCYHHDAG